MRPRLSRTFETASLRYQSAKRPIRPSWQTTQAFVFKGSCKGFSFSRRVGHVLEVFGRGDRLVGLLLPIGAGELAETGTDDK